MPSYVFQTKLIFTLSDLDLAVMKIPDGTDELILAGTFYKHLTDEEFATDPSYVNLPNILSALAKYSQDHPELTTLSIEERTCFPDWRTDAILMLSAFAPTVVRLNMRACSFWLTQAEYIKAFSTMLAQSHYETLDLSKNILTKNSLVSLRVDLMAALDFSQSKVRHLILDMSAISRWSMHEIEALSLASSRLETLSLQRCKLSKLGLETAQALFTQLPQTLRTLDLSHNKRIAFRSIMLNRWLMDLSVSEIKLSHKDIHGLCRLAIQEMSQRLFTNTNVERITFDAPERVEAKTLEGLKRYRAQNKPTRRRTLMFCHDEMRKRNEAAAAKRKDVELDDVPMDVMKLIARHI